jgi:hypothetical protein
MENNNSTPEKDSINEVLEKISRDEVKIHPKTYFRIKFAFLMFLVFLIIAIAIFIASFVVFSFKISGNHLLVGLGPNGWMAFLAIFPWTLFIIDMLLIILLEWLLRSFKFVYKVPIFYLILSTLAIMILSGFVVAQTPLHKDLLIQSGNNSLIEPFESLYEGARNPKIPPKEYGIFSGTAVSVGDNVMIVDIDNPTDNSTDEFTIMVSDPNILKQVNDGDSLFIKGEVVDEGKIEAQEVKDVDRKQYEKKQKDR